MPEAISNGMGAPASWSARLAGLRATLAEAGVDGFLLTRGDEHLGEYVAPYAERLAWLSGFTGSAGGAIVLRDRAAAYSDGRYVLQLAEQTDGALWERLHQGETPPEKWLAAAGAGGRIGYDPRLISAATLARYEAAGVVMVALERNPVDAAWTDRPAPPLAPAMPQPEAFTGRASGEKRREIASVLAEAGEDAVVLTDPASVAWLLNLRGGDIPFTPFALAFAILRADATATLFIAPEKLDAAMHGWLGNEVAVAAPDALASALDDLSGRRVRVDANGAAVWFKQRLEQAGATVSPTGDPCLLPKARKSDAEQEGARSAHLRDAAAVCRFLVWLRSAAGRETELSAATRLDAFRAEAPEYRGESFPAISGSGPNGAIIHYRVTPESDRAIGADEVYLIDSGGQYVDGTTDITRTIWTGPHSAPQHVREEATRVLKGHIALARTIFPKGVTGARLDALARTALWAAGLDYDHGTGHGVGSYLSVHEGPCSISPAAPPVPLAAGMILSNEPGFYRNDGYGIRLENLLLVQPAAVASVKPGRIFLEFETLTLVPFDRRLIAPELLNTAERNWIDSYHTRVRDAVAPFLDPLEQEWLGAACAPL